MILAVPVILFSPLKQTFVDIKRMGVRERERESGGKEKIGLGRWGGGGCFYCFASRISLTHTYNTHLKQQCLDGERKKRYKRRNG